MRFLYTACSNHLPLLWNSPRRRIHWRCRRFKTCIRTCISPHTTVPGFAYLARCRLFHTCVCVRACMSVRERGREREREMQREREFVRVCACMQGAGVRVSQSSKNFFARIKQHSMFNRRHTRHGRRTHLCTQLAVLMGSERRHPPGAQGIQRSPQCANTS